MTNKTRLIRSLLVGFAFAFLTWLLIQGHLSARNAGAAITWLGTAIVVLLSPGIITGIITSGNVHTFSEWIVVSANFVFYSALSYLFLMVWQKFRTKSHANEKKSFTPRLNGPVDPMH